MRRVTSVEVSPSDDIGTDLFTVEFDENGFNRYPGQSKCFHVIELQNGRLTMQPNNFLRWSESSFTDPQGDLSWLRRQREGLEGLRRCQPSGAIPTSGKARRARLLIV